MKPILALVLVCSITFFFGIVAYVQLRSLRDFSTYAAEFEDHKPAFQRSSEATIIEQSHNAPSPAAMPFPHFPNASQLPLDMQGIHMEVISWQPRIFLFDNILSPEECDELVERSDPKMEKSTVVDVSNGKSISSSVRTSTGAFLTEADFQVPYDSKEFGRVGPSDTLTRINQRLAHVTMTAPENGEALQVLRYEKGQYYRPHHDWFADSFNKARGGQRIATVLMYLTDVEEGGQTIFPNAGKENGQSPQSQCGPDTSRGLSVVPKKGRAVVFWNCKPDYVEDPGSLHGGCAVIRGTKWSATKWIRSGKFT